MVGGNAGGTTIGVAPGATVDRRPQIFNDQGAATSTAIHRGFQWLLDPDGNPGSADAADVVNDSWTLSSAAAPSTSNPTCACARPAILPVFSAGNYGPTARHRFSARPTTRRHSPVGATDNTNVIPTRSSSRGPSACGPPSRIVPRAVAPGVNVRTTDLYGLLRHCTPVHRWLHRTSPGRWPCC